MTIPWYHRLGLKKAGRNQGCQVIMRKIRIHVWRASRGRLKNPYVGNMGIKIKEKTSPVKNFLPFFYKYTEFNFFDILITKLYITSLKEYAHTSILAFHTCALRPWSSWTTNSDEKLNVNKHEWLLEKHPFESFAKFSVNFQDATSFGKILRNLIQISVKFWEKRKFFKIL